MLASSQSYRILIRHPKHHLSTCTNKAIKVKPKFNHHRPSFGIIAALTQKNIIGVDGSLPWEKIPQDKAHFVQTTRDKILIIGRKSFAEEDPSGNHVAHSRSCIVLSKTMQYEELSRLKLLRGGPELKLARSFEEALDIAYALINPVEHNEAASIHCWVAGGSDVYKEALQHCNLQEVNLTYVDNCKIDEEIDQLNFNEQHNVTFFPMGVFHQIGFNEVSRSRDGICTFCVYIRPRRGGGL